jgi:hypothetical protein
MFSLGDGHLVMNPLGVRDLCVDYKYIYIHLACYDIIYIIWNLIYRPIIPVMLYLFDNG